MESIADIRQLPELGDDTIHIWGVHVPDMLNQLNMLHAVMCGEEQAKAARFIREADRQSSVAARGALRVLLSGYTGISAAAIEFSYSGNGKPGLVVPQAARLTSDVRSCRRAACDTGTDGAENAVHEISFNVSHSADWVVLAFGRNRNIGVDIEKIKREMDVNAIAARYFTPGELGCIEHAVDRHAMFFQLWARKEAYVKARGSGLFQELSSFEVPFEDGEKDGWFFHDLEAGSRHAASVVTDRYVSRYPCFDFTGLRW